LRPFCELKSLKRLYMGYNSSRPQSNKSLKKEYFEQNFEKFKQKTKQI